GVGVAVNVGVAVGVDVEVAVAVSVGTGVAVRVGVSVAVGVAVGVDVGVGVAAKYSTFHSTAPISTVLLLEHCVPCTRHSTPEPLAIVSRLASHVNDTT